MPAERQQAGLVEAAGIDEVTQHLAGQAPGAPGRQRRGVEDGPRPERREHREAVGLRAPLQQRRAVGADEVLGVLEEAGKPPPVPGGERRVRIGTGDPAVPQRIEVHRPPAVVVKAAQLAGEQLAVGVPAVSGVPGLRARHGQLDVCGFPWPAHRA